jgi:phosphoribosyl-ATP pyrophosphohydrolase/phosphoribosyl-AMP cyclohydrolase
MTVNEWLETLKFDDRGLIPAVVQDAANGEVLMVAYMNKDSVAKTLETGLAHYYSRSRNKLWLKGESSGHVQKVKEVRYDCDADCLLFLADQEVAACHTGCRSCFYRAFDPASGEVRTLAEPLFDPHDVYGKGNK